VAFYYSPKPLLNHLHHKSGGTRAHADFLTSSSPVHSVGDYYYALLHGHGFDRTAYIAKRLVGSLMAKFYVTKPWFIPVRLLAELRGLCAAWRLSRAGQSLISILLPQEPQ